MNEQLLGIHHVTAIAGDPQRNLDFYTNVIGLRAVKITVNFDDPGTYHFYFGDQTGRPGSLLTFFPWPRASKGRRGAGQIDSVAFSIPSGSLQFWMDRLRNHGIEFQGPTGRFHEDVLTFFDPDGLQLELIPHREADRFSTPAEGSVPYSYAVIGIHSISLLEATRERTGALLSDTLHFRLAAAQDNRLRFETGPGGPGCIVDVILVPHTNPGHVAVGTVHHVAWRTPDDAEQSAWRDRIAADNIGVTPVIDRLYFHSIYFREPGGALFEIATDPPGFTIDEEPSELGTRLKLPPWLEPNRSIIERKLPALALRGFGRAA
jgi:glyoxalase family protein